MCFTTVPRKRTTLTLDIDAVNAIQTLASKANMSLARYVEAIMVTEAKTKGVLPHNYQLLGETRGKRWDLEGKGDDQN
jgi:hypothetical protein